MTYSDPPFHHLNNVLNERVSFLRYLGLFLGSCLVLFSSMILVLSEIAFKCTMLRCALFPELYI